ncbi:hypothetical protein FP026_00775 [Rhizobium tropici]|uniref:Uncharacterized protein n=1 Tax=Rhizobium tropici TaxID=398 RepID=A0A5B0WF39_RHITR|nr:hypothetical protein FP026_00775 [Rhizobium tropici]
MIPEHVTGRDEHEPVGEASGQSVSALHGDAESALPSALAQFRTENRFALFLELLWLAAG